MTQLPITTTTDGREVVVTVSGELDLETGPQLRDALAGILNRADAVLLDLTGVTFVDSTGLQALVATRRRARLSDKAFRLRITAGTAVDRILTLTGLTDAFDIERTPA